MAGVWRAGWMEGGKPISRRLVGALLLVRLEPRRYCPSCVKDIPRALFCRRGPRDCLLQAGGEGQRPATTRGKFLFFKKKRQKKGNKRQKKGATVLGKKSLIWFCCQLFKYLHTALKNEWFFNELIFVLINFFVLFFYPLYFILIPLQMRLFLSFPFAYYY